MLRDWERIARQAGAGTADGWIRAELSGRAKRWGRLVLCGYRGDRAAGRLLADRAAEALVLHRMLGGDGTHAGGPGTPGGSWDSWEAQSARSLLTDLVSGAATGAATPVPGPRRRTAGQPARLRPARRPRPGSPPG